MAKRNGPMRADAVGHQFNHLTIICDVACPGKRRVLCRCACGNQKEFDYYAVRRGTIKSCGCILRDAAARRRAAATHTTHGEVAGGKPSPEYGCWRGMKSRCLNPKSPAYKWYGAKGVGVAAAWQSSFESFLADVGRRPTAAHSLDRIDPSGDYAPGNVRWATLAQQSRNKLNNRNISAFGKTMILSDWATETGLNLQTLTARLNRGVPAEEALSTPVRRNAA